MRWVIIFLFGFIAFPVFSGYTVTWVAPTENTDGTPLTDLAGFELWCIPAANTYGNPLIFNDPSQTSYASDWASPTGDWKCKMRAFNASGVRSADSAEVRWVCLDPDGDGNCQSEGSITIMEPGAPDVVIECTADGGTCRSNIFTVTRKGFYTIAGPDGVWFIKPDGSTRQVTTRDEAYEWISKDGRSGKFIINPPPYEVDYQ